MTKPKLDPNRMIPFVDKQKVKALMDQRGWRIIDLWYEMRALGWDGSPHAIQHITAPSRRSQDARMSTLWYMSRAFGLSSSEDLLHFVRAGEANRRPRLDYEIGEGRRTALAKKAAKKRSKRGDA